jgi:predicted secreted protein
VEEVLDSPTSTSSPAEDVLLDLYSLKPSESSLAQIWNGKSSGQRLARALGQGRQEQEWRRGVVDVVAAETGEPETAEVGGSDD